MSDPDATLLVFGSALSTCRAAGAKSASLVPACRRVAIARDGEDAPEGALLFSMTVRARIPRPPRGQDPFWRPAPWPAPMRLGLVAGALALLLAAGQIHAWGGLLRPHAVLAGQQGLPEDGSAGVAVAWPAQGRFACDAHCELEVPAGAAGELWLTWDGTRTPGFVAALGDVAAIPAFDAARLGPVHGGERVHVWGSGNASLVVVPPAPGAPDLVALVPANLGQALGPARGHGDPSLRVPGCLDEEARAGAKACLRFTTGAANIGGVPLALASDERDGAAAMVQALPGGDHLAGVATYHPSHGHFHYARFVAFDLYAHDPATGLRGAAVGTAAKTGFCMVDFGPVDAAPAAAPKTFWRDGCAPGQRHLAMGINPGWYDIYRWFLPEQYLDPTGLPDGTYELVVTLDPDGTLVDGNPLDDRASIVFLWHDGVATPLEGHGLYRLVPQPS